MKTKIFILLSAIFLLVGCAVNSNAAEKIVMKIGDPVMQVDGQDINIDNDGTTPVIINGRTMLPVRAIAEALGLNIAWNEGDKTVTVTTAAQNDNKENAEPQKTTGKKILVAYYSAQNHTKGAAEAIADELKADTFVITPKEPYTEADLDWTDDNSRVNAEHDAPDTRHIELESSSPESFADYDVVFVGYPIWWGSASWVVDDFIKNNDFTGKTVIPFCTSQASGLGESGKELEEMAGTGNWLEGKRFPESFDEKEVRQWASSLKLD